MQIEDFQFNEKCWAFLKKLESDYGKKIQIELVELKDEEHGNAKSENCIPLIKINKENKFEDKEFNIIVIIHEAFHLRMLFDGMPLIGYSPSSRYHAKFDKQYFEWFNTRFWDKVTHHYFFPKIKNELDLNPYSITKELVIDILNGNKLIPDDISELGLVGYLFQTWIEVDDKSYFDGLEELIQRKYNSIGIDKGEYIIKIMQANPLTNFDTCLVVFEKIFNYLHKEDKICINIPRIFNTKHNDIVKHAFSIIDYV